MKQKSILLFTLLLLQNIFCQNSEEYQLEEYNVINDVFVELIGEHNYYQEGFIPLMPDQYLVEYAKNPDKFENELKSADQQFSPFPYSKNLIATNGQKQRLELFKKEFYQFSDSIKKQFETQKLLVFTDDTLTSINQLKRKEFIKNVGKDSLLLNLYSSEELKSRNFEFEAINDKGKFLITNDEYPDREVRKKTLGIKEIGRIRISRVIFNADYSKGYFFYLIHKNDLNAGESIIRVEKENGKWVIKDDILLWVS